ncbi:hypothetical protein ACMD2_20097, partial [Ananas comosus]
LELSPFSPNRPRFRPRSSRPRVLQGDPPPPASPSASSSTSAAAPAAASVAALRRPPSSCKVQELDNAADDRITEDIRWLACGPNYIARRFPHATTSQIRQHFSTI